MQMIQGNLTGQNGRINTVCDLNLFSSSDLLWEFTKAEPNKKHQASLCGPGEEWGG
jgi:hypothetical protein